jgi:hypothetical protein
MSNKTYRYASIPTDAEMKQVVVVYTPEARPDLRESNYRDGMSIQQAADAALLSYETDARGFITTVTVFYPLATGIADVKPIGLSM